MKKNRHHFIQLLRPIRLLTTFLACFAFLLSCGDDGSSEPKSVGSARISWSMACPPDETLSIICQVYDADNEYLTYGGPWNCDSGAGTVEKIRTGSDTRLVVLAEDEAGEIQYRGSKTGVEIQENLTTAADDIPLYPFVASLIEPANEAVLTGHFR